MTKTKLFSVITALFCSCLIISNVLAGKTFALTSSIVLPCAVIIFPVVYIVNDVLSEIYGFKKAKNVVLLGFGINVLAVVAYWIAILLPSPVFNVEVGEAFRTVLGSTPRILLASFLAYLVGSLANAKIMTIMKAKDGENKLALRCILSTLVGEGIDACIFISIAFLGTMPLTSLLVMIIAQALFKTIYEAIVYPVTKLIIQKVKALPE